MSVLFRSLHSNLMSLFHSYLHWMFMLLYMSDPYYMLHFRYLLYLLLALLYLFSLLILLLLLYYSRYPLSWLHNYLFTSYYYLVYMLSHYYLYYNFTYFHSSSLSHSMLHFHNFILLHYSILSNLLSLLYFIHYYLTWNYLLLVLRYLLSMSLFSALRFLNYLLHMPSYFMSLAVFLMYWTSMMSLYSMCYYQNYMDLHGHSHILPDSRLLYSNFMLYTHLLYYY